MGYNVVYLHFFDNKARATELIIKKYNQTIQNVMSEYINVIIKRELRLLREIIF